MLSGNKTKGQQPVSVSHAAVLRLLLCTAKWWKFCRGIKPAGKQRCDHLVPPVCSSVLLFEKDLESQVCLLYPLPSHVIAEMTD